MLKSLTLAEKFIQRLQKSHKSYRTFLSEAYKCTEAWDARLNSPLLRQIKPVDFYMEMEHKYQSEGLITAVDVDLFANAIQDSHHIEELESTLYKIRMTRETSFTLDSTHHAAVRYCLQHSHDENLLHMLNDRLNYGVFCDYFCYNLSMDYFIKKEDFTSAAKMASFLMLQEMFENPISNALGIYSCHKFLENPDDWQVEDPKEVRLREEPKEEVKVRVNYIRNEYFDDHFDLWKPKHIVGKTLVSICRSMDDSLGQTCYLRGLLLWEKFEDALSFLEEIRKNQNFESIYKEGLDLMKKDIANIVNTQESDAYASVQKLLSDFETYNLHPGNLSENIINLVNQSIQEQTDKDIRSQTEAYGLWDIKRIAVLKKQLEEFDKKERLKKVEEIKKELEEKERLLTFFEKEEEIELKIEEKLEYERKRYGGPEKVYRSKDDDYFSPEELKKIVSKPI